MMNQDSVTNNFANSIDLLTEDVFGCIFKFIIDKYCLSHWPCHLHAPNLYVVHQCAGREEMMARWREHSVLCRVSHNWRALAEKFVEKLRLDSITCNLQLFETGEWDCFELIYQPFGYDLPERIASRASLDH